MNCYFVFGYRNVRTALTSRVFATANTFRRTRTAIGLSVLDTDGEAHSRMRGALLPAFRPAAVSRHATTLVGPAVRRLLDDALAQAGPGWLPEFATRLPVSVAAEIVGLPAGADEYLREAMRPLVVFIDHGPVDYSTVVARRDELRTYIRTAMRRSSRTDQLVHMLGAGGLSEPEIVDNALLALVAATETTTSAMVNVAARVCGQPHLFDLLRRSPHLVGQAVTETLRHEPPLHVTLRYTTTEVSLGEYRLPKGAAVQVCLASANRDPSVYADPDVWQLQRQGRPSLAFGAGPHHCLGSALAREEIEALIRELTHRFESLRVVSPEVPRPRGRTFRSVPDLVLG
ncbi:cytochrome P450 [Streptomyces europaeiscabiei]|uniref:cytochrome P450 n=1 Tax=Streptomyces europaeiscabiei TaxID=146819 RepID=UPI0029B7C621|nr:cytochrome P450 [Streptomyces europaeiscabiei]MDX3611297.1 cytochrome P450 [Streptomyces europaeiscabiei]